MHVELLVVDSSVELELGGAEEMEESKSKPTGFTVGVIGVINSRCLSMYLDFKVEGEACPSGRRTGRQNKY